MSATPEERLQIYVKRADATDPHVVDAEGGRRGGERTKGNVWNTIKPYWHDGAWLFDDPQRRLQKKPVVARNPEIIDHVLRQAGVRPRQPFKMTFGDHDVSGPGYRFVLEWVRDSREGHWYRWGATEVLCSALVRYFDSAPKQIFCQVTARRTPFSVFQNRDEELRGATSGPTARDVRPQAGPR